MSSEGFPARLRESRLAHELTQGDLATLAGYKDRRGIWWLESGKGKPDIAQVERIAVILGVSAAWLAYGAGK